MSFRFTSYKRQVLDDFKMRRKRALEIVGGTGERYTVEKLEQNHSVQSGVLKGSITHEPRGEDTVAIGTNIDYAPYVELGHHQQPGRYVPAIKKRLVKSYVPAKPFLRPAIEGHVKQFENIIKTEMNM